MRRIRKAAGWFEDTARAFEEIGEIALAIDWAKHATDFGWEQLAKAYQKTDPAVVLSVYRRLVENELTATGARHYQAAARRLKIMRRLAATDNDSAVEVDTFVADLREQHRRRPRLQREFDRAGLP
jgi:uncharacterized Zn finger protein